MAITAAQVKELRERTGLGMMDCKKALVATDGDIDKAIEDLRKSSALKADKKAGRIAADGAVAVKVADDGSYGVMIEINSETDFVARDENFQGFVNTILEAAFVQKQSDVAALMAGELETARAALVQKIGENITVRRIDIVDGGVVGSYVHGNGRIAVLSSVEGASQEIAKDVAMHAAATNPMVVNADDVPADVVAKEKEIYVAQAADSGKPPEIIEKMVTGRVRKYLAEVSLVEQAFVKNPDQKVGAMVKAAGGSVTAFVRYEVGEGIEKEVVDFAEEVAAQVKQ